MATLKIYDRADEFRIEIAGRFGGDAVEEVRSNWRDALLETSLRRFTVDISRLSGYDAAGRKLLSEMYRHGAQIAAGTPLALVFLNEISAPVRRGPAPTLIPTTTRQDREVKALVPIVAVASGQ